MAGVELASRAPMSMPAGSLGREKRRGVPVCVLDDDGAFVAETVELLQYMGFPAAGTTDPGEALAQVRERRCRAVVSDTKMPGARGFEFLNQVLKIDPTLEVLLLTGSYSTGQAIEAIRHGARDYLARPVDAARLERKLDDIAAQHERRRRVRQLEEALLQKSSQHGIVGQSPQVLEMLGLMRRAAPHFTTALVSGPTGAGKERAARALHEMSPAAGRRFAVCNCSSLSESLQESHLFGHTRRAFGRARTAPTCAGLFESADGGTVFLDEFTDISPRLQARLLRLLDKQEIQPRGAHEARRLDVRLVAATSRNLRAEVIAGRFREDLYYRLSILEIHVPPLAERAGDVYLLAHHFLKQFNQTYGRPIEGFTQRALACMARYPWPGNVRELENAVSTACITAATEMIDVDDLPEGLRRATPNHGMEERRRPLTLDEVRREHIERVLQTCQGNRLRAAQMLGIGRTSLYRFLKRHGGPKRRETGLPARREGNRE